VSLSTHHARPVFAVSRLAENLIETVLALRLQGVYKLHAFVVLPSRVHLLLTPQGMPVERAVELIEAGFARHVDTVRAIWEPGFESHPVHSIRDLERLRVHLHQLPVGAGLSSSPELYPYSSAARVTATSRGNGCP
jgi:putative transposase